MIRWFARVLGGLLALLTVFFCAAELGGLVPHSGAGAPVPEPAGGDAVEIALLYGPIHVDFMLPADAQTRAALAPFAAAGVPVSDQGVAHFIVGWGARDFYTTAGTYSDITLGATWRAVTGDASVLRADVTGPLPRSFNPPTLRLSRDAYAAMLEAIMASASGAPVIGAGHTATDGFLEATGRFDILRTCNTWVADMLAAGGVDAGAWTPTPYALRIGLWRSRAHL